VNQATFTCWLELTERLGTAMVTVQATNIGQITGRNKEI
jgi:hypothetical protein